eukprot:TRINITY_DN863_c0_g1_i1.p1 TRINITY_DN863_c0_g1~~TRINITY_DN863_c0_g1_i1.p1  ORF type:complete len:950 (-),score=180.96 TRINITY_DN863_c0_g1_i1:175-2772(-)
MLRDDRFRLSLQILYHLVLFGYNCGRFLLFVSFLTSPFAYEKLSFPAYYTVLAELASFLYCCVVSMLVMTWAKAYHQAQTFNREFLEWAIPLACLIINVSFFIILAVFLGLGIAVPKWAYERTYCAISAIYNLVLCVASLFYGNFIINSMRRGGGQAVVRRVRLMKYVLTIAAGSAFLHFGFYLFQSILARHIYLAILCIQLIVFEWGPTLYMLYVMRHTPAQRLRQALAEEQKRKKIELELAHLKDGTNSSQSTPSHTPTMGLLKVRMKVRRASASLANGSPHPESDSDSDSKSSHGSPSGDSPSASSVEAPKRRIAAGRSSSLGASVDPRNRKLLVSEGHAEEMILMSNPLSGDLITSHPATPPPPRPASLQILTPPTMPAPVPPSGSQEDSPPLPASSARLPPPTAPAIASASTTPDLSVPPSASAASASPSAASAAAPTPSRPSATASNEVLSRRGPSPDNALSAFSRRGPSTQGDESSRRAVGSSIIAVGVVRQGQGTYDLGEGVFYCPAEAPPTGQMPQMPGALRPPVSPRGAPNSQPVSIVTQDFQILPLDLLPSDGMSDNQDTAHTDDLLMLFGMGFTTVISPSAAVAQNQDRLEAGLAKPKLKDKGPDPEKEKGKGRMLTAAEVAELKKLAPPIKPKLEPPPAAPASRWAPLSPSALFGRSLAKLPVPAEGETSPRDAAATPDNLSPTGKGRSITGLSVTQQSTTSASPPPQPTDRLPTKLVTAIRSFLTGTAATPDRAAPSQPIPAMGDRVFSDTALHNLYLSTEPSSPIAPNGDATAVAAAGPAGVPSFSLDQANQSTEPSGSSRLDSGDAGESEAGSSVVRSRSVKKERQLSTSVSAPSIKSAAPPDPTPELV